MTCSPDLSPEAAEALLFPSALVSTRADTIAAYQWLTSRLGAAGYDAALAVLHARSLESDPALGALMRSPEALADVGAAAERFAFPADHRETHADAQRRAAAAAQKRYRRAIALQLAAADGHPLQGAARTYLDGLAADERASAERQAAAEAERADRDRAAAAASAASVEIAASETADAARLDRVRALQRRLATRLEAAQRAGTVARRCMLEHVFVGDGDPIPVSEILAGMATMAPDQIATIEAALDSEVA